MGNRVKYCGTSFFIVRKEYILTQYWPALGNVSVNIETSSYVYRSRPKFLFINIFTPGVYKRWKNWYVHLLLGTCSFVSPIQIFCITLDTARVKDLIPKVTKIMWLIKKIFFKWCPWGDSINTESYIRVTKINTL